MDTRKWPDRPSRRATAVLLGVDRHGTWLGHEPDGTAKDFAYLFLIPAAGWWIGRHFPDGGWKLDVTTPPVWQNETVKVVDLDLDVRRLHGRTWIEDEDEFEARSHEYPPDVVVAAQAATQELHRRLDSYDAAFGVEADDWLAVLHRQTATNRSTGVVLFDMGGVLTVTSGSTHREAWCRRLGLDSDTLDWVQAEAIGPGWEGGRRPEEILTRLAQNLGITTSDAVTLIGDLHADQTLDADLMSTVASLPASVAAGIISNNGADVRRHWRRAHGLETHFWPIVISGEERIAKPDPRIYRIAAARAGVAAEGCLFVDDSYLNVEGATSIGMHGIVHTETARTVQLIRSWAEQHGDPM